MRILIVEDEKPIAAFMQKGLEQDGHICTCAYDGIRAEQPDSYSSDLLLAA